MAESPDYRSGYLAANGRMIARVVTTPLLDDRLFAYLRHMPNVGAYRPKGWRLAEHRLVDKTGLGLESEPALTVAGLLRWVRVPWPGHGYAILSESQFQVTVGRFERRRDHDGPDRDV